MIPEREPFFQWDCRFFRGDKPCIHKRDCQDCPHYQKIGTRVLIIKLGAMGDVIRTTPLISGLRQSFPQCHITWLTLSNIMPLMEGIGIDRLLPYDWRSGQQLAEEHFHLAICLDKEADILALMNRIQAEKKYGYLLGDHGEVKPAGPSSVYLFHLGVSDELKFRVNRKSYTELIFDCLGLPYQGEKYLLPDLSVEKEWIREQLATMHVPEEACKVAFNTGAGKVFATKKWSTEGYITLGRQLVEEYDARIILLGSDSEQERNQQIAEGIGLPDHILLMDTRDSIRRLAALIGICDLMITSDTLGMHLGLGLERPTIALFGPTCHQEIDLFGCGQKIISDYPCCPCYRSSCEKEINCMEAISAENVMQACRKILSKI